MVFADRAVRNAVVVFWVLEVAHCSHVWVAFESDIVDWGASCTPLRPCTQRGAIALNCLFKVASVTDESLAKLNKACFRK